LIQKRAKLSSCLVRENILWKEHFAWSLDGLRIIGKTSIGRATGELLELNRERILFIREADVAVNRHPPIDDLD
jgi:hypothetical protein